MASTYLQKNTATATDAQKFTYSGWLKRGAGIGSSGTGNRFYIGYLDGNNRFYITFSDTIDKIFIYAKTGGTEQVNWETTRTFRDSSSWYHIVVSADSTQGTQDDRLKLYVNGVQETSFTKSTSPGQNFSWGNQLAQSNNTLRISGDENASNLYDGAMSHIHFIDGTAYDASAFGETDATTGEWVGKTSPSVTYGNNGFFILKDGNGITDQSGEGNDFTLGGGTLTDLKDNPDNVFATLNPLDVFNNSGRTLSNGNNTYTTSSGNNSEVAGTLAASSGKYYFETKIAAQSGSTSSTAKYGVIGVKKIDKGTLAAGEAATIYSDGRKNNGYDSVSGATPGYTLNDIVQVALDLDNNQIFFGLNGNWGDNAGNFNQTFANATALYTSLSTVGDWTPYLNKNVTTDNTLTLSVNFGNGYFGTTAITTNSGNGYSGAEGASKFNYTVPAGYSALSTKGLNE